MANPDKILVSRKVFEHLKEQISAHKASAEKHYEVAKEAIHDLNELREAVNCFPLSLLSAGSRPDGTRYHMWINLLTRTQSTHYDTVVEALIAGHRFYKENSVNISEATTVVGIPTTPGPEECDG
jgi:hypothetical protein